jgi:hypothetical protein
MSVQQVPFQVTAMVNQYTCDWCGLITFSDPPTSVGWAIIHRPMPDGTIATLYACPTSIVAIQGAAPPLPGTP